MPAAACVNVLNKFNSFVLLFFYNAFRNALSYECDVGGFSLRHIRERMMVVQSRKLVFSFL